MCIYVYIYMSHLIYVTLDFPAHFPPPHATLAIPSTQQGGRASLCVCMCIYIHATPDFPPPLPPAHSPPPHATLAIPSSPFTVHRFSETSRKRLGNFQVLLVFERAFWEEAEGRRDFWGVCSRAASQRGEAFQENAKKKIILSVSSQMSHPHFCQMSEM